MRTRAYGTGAIIRDCRGRFVAMTIKKFRGLTNALRLELMAVKEGLRFALDLGIRAII